jgi:hypothetical protein
MRFLHRLNDLPGTPSGDGDSNPGDSLQQARSDADRLLATGDAAIQRALSGGNSEAFLRAGRQQGGQ